MKNPKEKKRQQDEGEADGYFLLSLRLAKMMAEPEKKEELESKGYRHSTDIFKDICKIVPEFENEWHLMDPEADWVTFCGFIFRKFYRNHTKNQGYSNTDKILPLKDGNSEYRFWTRLSSEIMYNIYTEWKKDYRSCKKKNQPKSAPKTEPKKAKFKLSFGTVSRAWADSKKTIVLDGRMKKKGYNEEHSLIINEERLKKERENEDI